MARRPTVARLILREAASAQPGVASPLVRAGGALVEWLRALIDEGVASGELKPLTDPHRFISLMGATTVFHFAAMPSLMPGVPFDPSSPAELERHKREMLLRGAAHAGHRSRGADPVSAGGGWISRSPRNNSSWSTRCGPCSSASVPPRWCATWSRTARVPEQPWKSARELGWTAIDVPEAEGGLELGFQPLGLVVEQHGRFIAPGPFLATVTQFLPLVREAGSDAQRQRFAAAAAAGELTGALAIDHGRASEHARRRLAARAAATARPGSSTASARTCSTATRPTRSRWRRASMRATASACSWFPAAP